MKGRYLLAFLLIAGCASATERQSLGEHADGGITLDTSIGGSDSGHAFNDAPKLSPDAPDSGSGSGSATLSQTTSSTDGDNSIACQNGAQTETLQNSYYRVFTLSSYGITSAFQVSNVTLTIESSSSAPTATLIVGTYSGTPGGTTLTAADITAVQTNNAVTIPNNANPSTMNVPITATIPANANLVVELQLPAGGYVFMGANADGETEPGYVSSASCSTPGATPTSMTSLAGTETDLIMTVTGTY